MTSARRSAFITLAAALLGASPMAAEEGALEAWLARQARLRSLDAAFVQERRLPALREPLRTPGRLSILRPAMVRWQLGEPAETVVIGDGDTFTIIDHREDKVRKIPGDSPQAAQFAMLGGAQFGDAAAFREAFEVVATRLVDGIHQYTLRPRDRRTRARLPWVFLDIETGESGGVLRALEIELQDKSRIRTVFHNPQFDVAFDAGHFTAPATNTR